jgi:hypothetical protein
MRFACLLFALVTCGYSQSFPLESIEGLKPVRLNAEAGNFKGKKAVKVTEPPDAKGEDRYVLLPVPDFQDGTIEAEMTGRPASGAMEGARGFVGIAFRVVPDSASKFEMFYLRPTNGLLSNRPGHDAQSREPEWPRPPGKGFRALRFCPADWIGTSHTRLRVSDSVRATDRGGARSRSEDNGSGFNVQCGLGLLNLEERVQQEASA